MPRTRLWPVAVAIVLAGAGSAWAQDVWAPYDFDFENNIRSFPRGTGFYLSLTKLGVTWALFLLWVRTADWVNDDSQHLKLPHFKVWNLLVVLTFSAAVALVFVLPNFWWIGFPLMLVAYAAPLGAYVWKRNQGRHSSDKVFTPAHLRYWLSQKLRPLGIKIAAEKQEKKKIAPVVLEAVADDQRDRNVRTLSAKQLEGFESSLDLMHEAFVRRAAATMLDYTADAVALRFLIDGIWHDGESRPRAEADPMLVALKTLTGLNPQERRARQQGLFQAEDQPHQRKYKVRLTSQGTKTGERVLLQLDDGSLKKWRLTDTGMRQSMQEALKELLGNKNGMVLVAAPPGNGLTSLTVAAANAIDRYMRSVVGLEEASRKELDVENVPVTTYDTAAGQTAESVMPGLMRMYPDAYVVPEVPSVKLLDILCDEASDDRLVVAGVPGRDTADAVAQLLAQKAPAKKLAATLRGVVCCRLVRKLCEKCKEAYPPPPKLKEQLTQMGMPMDRVESFFRPPQANDGAPKQAKLCAECGGLGYVGRAAIFELMVVNDAVRKAILQGGTAEALRTAARDGAVQTTLQDEGLVLVVKGVTSVEELRRVLKE